MKETILYIKNTPLKNGMCAIDNSGNLYGDALALSKIYDVKQFHASSGEDVIKLYEIYNPKVIFYFFCSRTAPWMMEKQWKKNVKSKNVVLDVDATQNSVNNFNKSSYYDFDALVGLDSTFDVKFSDNVYKVNHLRPMASVLEYIDTGIPKIGFHGSPTLNKGIIELVDYAQTQFDNAEICFHCPIDIPNSGHSPENLMENIRKVKSRIVKPGFKFSLSTDIISYEEVVQKLSLNTVNCYFMPDNPYTTHASSIHTALSARRPIAIRKSRAHLAYINLNPSICVEENSLVDIIKNGFEPLEQLYNNFTPQNVCKDFEKIIYKLMNPSKLSFSF